MKIIYKKNSNRIFCLDINDKRLYYNEIVDPKILKQLYYSERPIFRFSSKVILAGSSFTTFLAKYRNNRFNEGDILLLRISKDNKQAQFISKIYKWGRINIPSKFIQLLKLKNNEKIYFEIISRNQELDIANNNCIDLAKIDGSIIPRKNDYITIYIKRKIPITLQRFVKVTPELLELVYLIHGDGHYQDKLYFVNKNPELHKFVLEQFKESFKIPKNVWRARVLISNLKLGNYAKKYWKGVLNLDKNQFYSVSKSKLNTSERGNLRIILDQTIVSCIFRFIFNQIRSSNHDFLHALNGLLCAEGGAQISEVGLHKITLSFSKEEKKMFKDILDNLNLIYIEEQCKTFVIQGWINHYLFFKAFLSKNVIPFMIHSQRQSNAIIGFLNHIFTKTMKKYLSVLKQRDSITLKEFSQLLKIREDSIIDTIRKSRYSQFTNIGGNGIRGKPFIISITKEGGNLLDIINKMEEML